MNKCLYLRVRHKKGQLYYYCTKRREIVEKMCYTGCLDKEYKITNNIFDNIPQDGSDKITRFIYCNLTKYEKIDKIVVEIKNENQKGKFIYEG